MPTKGNGRRQESALTVGMMLSKDVYLTVGALNLGDYIMFAAPKGLVNFWGTSGKECVSPNGWGKSTYWEIYHFLSTVVQMIRVSSSAHNLSSSLFNIFCVPSSNGLRGSPVCMWFCVLVIRRMGELRDSFCQLFQALRWTIQLRKSHI